jgi:hypothetical protein
MFDFKCSILSKSVKKKLYKFEIFDLKSLIDVLGFSIDDFVKEDVRKLSKVISKTYLNQKAEKQIRKYLSFAKASILQEHSVSPKMSKKTLLLNVKIPKELTPILDLETAIICAMFKGEKSIFEILDADKWLGQYPIHISKRDFYKYPKIVRELKNNADFIFSR